MLLALIERANFAVSICSSMVSPSRSATVMMLSMGREFYKAIFMER